MTDPDKPVGEGQVPTAPGPVQSGILADRARRLLVGGIVGAHLLVLPVVIIGGLVAGPPGMISVALGGALALLFYTFGQAVQVRFAGASATTLMAASLASFGLRAGLLATVIVAWLNLGQPMQERFVPLALMAGVLAGVIGWLAGLSRAYSRLRILAFDDPEPTR